MGGGVKSMIHHVELDSVPPDPHGGETTVILGLALLVAMLVLAAIAWW